MADTEQPTALPPISVVQLRMLADRGAAVSNRQLVDALVRFANTGSYAARALLQSGASEDALLARYGDEPLMAGMQRGQAELRDALDKIVKGNVPTSLAADWRRRAASLLFLRVFVPGGEHRYRWEQFESWASEPSPVIANAILLLLEEPFAGTLCRCGWAKCGRFFFVAASGRGRPVSGYCPGTDHRERARPALVKARRAEQRAAKQRAAARRHK
jgi:uncharacterized membrane protein